MEQKPDCGIHIDPTKLAPKPWMEMRGDLRSDFRLTENGYNAMCTILEAHGFLTADYPEHITPATLATIEAAVRDFREQHHECCAPFLKADADAPEPLLFLMGAFIVCIRATAERINEEITAKLPRFKRWKRRTRDNQWQPPRKKI
jgi:hypothetical protein